MSDEHKPDCACSECMSVLREQAAGRMPIETQIEVVVDFISYLEGYSIDAVELLPVLKTLQFVRDNQEEIRKIPIKNGKSRKEVSK